LFGLTQTFGLLGILLSLRLALILFLASKLSKLS
jgi:hypothetical protein